jgi:hypothetical protein
MGSEQVCRTSQSNSSFFQQLSKKLEGHVWHVWNAFEIFISPGGDTLK